MKIYSLIGTSCPSGQCTTGWICSIRASGGHSCDCPPGYGGTNCQDGFICYLFILV